MYNINDTIIIFTVRGALENAKLADFNEIVFYSNALLSLSAGASFIATSFLFSSSSSLRTTNARASNYTHLRPAASSLAVAN